MRESKLARNLALKVGLTIGFLIFCQIMVIVTNIKSKMIKSTRQEYTEIAKLYADKISATLESYLSALELYTKSDIVKTEDSTQIIAWIKTKAPVRNENFDYVSFVDKNGNFNSDTNTTTVVKDRDYFQAIMNGGKDYFIDNPVRSKVSGKLVIHVCKAAKVNGRTIGFFVANMGLDQINTIIENTRIGKTGCGSLFSSDGKLIATSGNKTEIENITTKSPDAAKFQKAIQGNTDFMWLKYKPNNRKNAFFSPIDKSGWDMAFMIDEKEIFQTIYSVSKITIISGIIITIALILVITLYFAKQMIPLTKVEKSIRKIAAGNADLTHRITLDKASNNEIGRVVDGFNQFTEKLHEIMKALTTSKEDLVMAGSDLEASTEDTASSISEIISNIQNMEQSISLQSDSVSQTAGAVNQIASNIESLNRMIESQGESVSQASAAVEEMIGNINSVNTSVGKMALSFDELDQRASNGVLKQEDVNAKILVIANESEALQEANAVISSIAEQTNLLAMNAAIEAAHAGEAGKGFSVVADEIRKLSETSSEQSKTIGDQLQKITAGIEQIVKVSKDASDAFSTVSSGMNSTSNLVREIKNAMEEQKEGSMQISESLKNMNESTLEVRNASEEMSEGNKAILTEIKSLQDATYNMKNGMGAMSTGAKKIMDTGSALSGIARQMTESIAKIGEQIGLFRI